jgi:hypothetical protein
MRLLIIVLAVALLVFVDHFQFRGYYTTVFPGVVIDYVTRLFR